MWWRDANLQTSAESLSPGKLGHLIAILLLSLKMHPSQDNHWYYSLPCVQSSHRTQIAALLKAVTQHLSPWSYLGFLHLYIWGRERGTARTSTIGFYKQCNNFHILKLVWKYCGSNMRLAHARQRPCGWDLSSSEDFISPSHGHVWLLWRLVLFPPWNSFQKQTLSFQRIQRFKGINYFVLAQA